MAIAYNDRILGDKEENIEQAIEHYIQALKVRMYENFPVDWAITQNNLASAYSYHIRGNKAEDIERAIKHYQNALKIFKLVSMPSDFRKTQRFVGDLYFDMGQWNKAVKSYKEAIKANDLLYSSGLSIESKRVEIVNHGYIYQNASLAACNLDLSHKALVFLEEGKTRLLIELLRLKMKQPEGVLNYEWKKYTDAAEKYRSATNLSDKEDYVKWEKRAHEALKELNDAVKIYRDMLLSSRRNLIPQTSYQY